MAPEFLGRQGTQVQEGMPSAARIKCPETCGCLGALWQGLSSK